MKLLLTSCAIVRIFLQSDEQTKDAKLMAAIRPAVLRLEQQQWSAPKLTQVKKEIYAAIAVQGPAAEEMQLAVANQVVGDAIDLHKQQQQHNERAIRQIVNILGNDSGAASLAQVYDNWATRSVQEVKAAYDPLYKQFTQAMLCARKYNWPMSKCVRVGLDIEKQTTAAGVEGEARVEISIDMIVAEVKREKILLRDQARGMKKILKLIAAEDTDLETLFGNWAKRSAKELKIAFQPLYRKFTQAMLCARKYNWPMSKCVRVGLDIEKQTTAAGVQGKKQVEMSIDMIAAEVKREKILLRDQARGMKKILSMNKKDISDRGKAAELYGNWAMQAKRVQTNDLRLVPPLGN